MAIIKTINNFEDTSVTSFMQDDAIEDIFCICKDPDNLKHLVNGLSANKLIHFISDGAWSMHDLVFEILKLYHPAELYLSTYALREFAMRQIINWLDKKLVIGVNMLLDTKSRTRTPEVIHLAQMNVNRIAFTNVHAKVTIIKTSTAIISINSSANWTSNPRLESGCISMNNTIGQFHINWLEKCLQNGEQFNN